MNPVMIRIMAVVGIIIGFVFMGLLYGYNEQLYASLSDHCDIDSERVITLRWGANTDAHFSLSDGNSTTCSFAANALGPYTGTTPAAADDADSATAANNAINAALPGATPVFAGAATTDSSRTVDFETPNGTDVAITFDFTHATASAAAFWAIDNATTVSGEWNSQIGLGGQFRTLTFLLIAVIPLALVAAVIAQAVPLIMSGGSSNVTDIVNKQTMGLLIAAAVIIAAPIMFEQASNAQNDLVGLGSAAQFLTITNLIFDLVPLVYTIGVMGLIIYGSGLVQRFGGGKGMSGVGMRMGM